jgi:hypothetical protein
LSFTTSRIIALFLIISEVKIEEKNKNKRKKLLKFILLLLCGLTIMVLLTFIPTLMSLETSGMSSIVGEYVTVFFEEEETAAREVFEVLESESQRIADALGFDAPKNINVYIYDRQSSMQIRRFGLLVLLLNVEWFVGTNIGVDVIMVSPANPGNQHDWDSIVQVSIHELVHAYNHLLNSNMRLWINEGLATYLSDMNPWEWGFVVGNTPTMRQMRTSNPLTFANIQGYQLSFTYIEYLHQTFGWESILTLARTNDFMEAFGMSESDIFYNWIDWLKAR